MNESTWKGMLTGVSGELEVYSKFSSPSHCRLRPLFCSNLAFVVPFGAVDSCVRNALVPLEAARLN